MPAEIMTDVIDSPEKKLFEWATMHGAVSEGVKPGVAPGGRRGLFATRDISNGEVVIKVPYHLFFNSVAARSSMKPSAQIFEQLLQEGTLSPRSTGILHLILEREDKTSMWTPYIECLPKTYDTCLFFGESALRALAGTPLFAATVERKKEVKAQYDSLFPMLSNKFPDVFPAEVFTFPAFVWATTAFSTRAFSFAVEGVPDTSCMLPVADLLNHHPGYKPLHWSFDEDEQCYVFTAGQDYKAGKEIFTNYCAGEGTNEQLLLHYGFVIEENSEDRFYMEMSDVFNEEELPQAKLDILQINGISTKQYITLDDFSADLMKALRVCAMDSNTHYFYDGHLPDGPIAARNELSALETLRMYLVRKIRESRSANLDLREMTAHVKAALTYRRSVMELMQSGLELIERKSRCFRSTLEMFQADMKQQKPEFDGVEIQDKVDVLYKWAKDNKIMCRFTPAEYRPVEFKREVRGVSSSSYIAEGEAVSCIPGSNLIHVGAAISKNHPLGGIFSQLRNDDIVDDDALMALFIIFEKHNSGSLWEKYFAMFKKKFTTPFYAKEDDIFIMKGTPLEAACRGAWNEVKITYANLFPSLSEKYPMFVQDIYDFDAFVWAWSLWHSRSMTVGVSNGQGFFRCIAPVADMMAHRPGVGMCDAVLGRDGVLRFTAQRDIRAGEQIFFDYGAASNTELVLYRGFSIMHNIDDEFIVNLPAISKDDPLKSRRETLLAQKSIGLSHRITSDFPVAKRMLDALRIVNMPEDDLEELEDFPHSREFMVTNPDTEKIVLENLKNILTTQLEGFSALPRGRDDEKVLNSGWLLTLSDLSRSIVVYRANQKRLLRESLAKLETLAKDLATGGEQYDE